MSVSSEFGRRAADDELCAAVAKAVADGDSDALRRLGFDGWGDYVQRLSELMNESVRDGLEQSDDFGALMSQVASPARYAHHLVNEAGTAIQTAKDKPLGIHIKPAEPEFDDDALKGTVGTAANAKSPEQAVETLADGLSYAVKKAGNDFIKLNAEQRSRAGFEVSVKRSGSSKCCEWCAARIGSWALKNAPDGVFGCHANCSCTVEYTSSTGAKTSARGANLNRYGAGAFVEVEYQPPHVMSREEAREKGGFDEPKRLTGGGNGGIIPYAADKMGKPITEKVPSRGKIKIHQRSGYGNIWVQDNSVNAKKSVAYISGKLSNSEYGEVERVIIAKSKDLQGIAAYYQSTNSLYWNEDLINSQRFTKLVGTDYFPAKTIDDVIEHELGGHKRHWGRVKELRASDPEKYKDLNTAKQTLEKELREYVTRQILSDPFYIKKTVSKNAKESFDKTGELNELIADVHVKNKQGLVDDIELSRLVKELLGYDD